MARQGKSRNSNKSLWIALRSFAGVCALMALAGCSDNWPIFQESVPRNAAEAATTHVAPITVAPWEEFVAAIQPQFQLTTADALQQSLPVTSSFDEAVRRAQQLRLALGLPTSSTISEAVSQATTTIPAEGLPETTGTQSTTETSTSASGTVPELPAANQVSPTALQPPTTSIQFGTDPILRYQNATSLYQEVQILNRYLANPARRLGYQPYFVRLQLAALPLRRNLPYDIYADFAFFSEFFKSDDSANPSLINRFNYKNNEALDKALSDKQCAQPIPAPVIPLLVTDNLELGNEARSSELLRELALALQATVLNVGVNAALSNLDQRLERAFGRDLNGLFTVTRAGDNVLRIRIGARRTVDDANFEMVPRTQNISLMLLVKKPSKIEASDCQFGKVEVFSSQTLRHATKGTALPQEGRKSTIARLGAIGDTFKLSKSWRERSQKHQCGSKETFADFVRGRLADPVQQGDYPLFRKHVQDCLEPEIGGRKFNMDELPNLWAEIVIAYADLTSRDFLSFDLPRQLPDSLTNDKETAEQTVFVVAEGTKATAAINQPYRLSAQTLNLVWRITKTTKDKCGMAAKGDLLASILSSAVTTTDRQITAVFENLPQKKKKEARMIHGVSLTDPEVNHCIVVRQKQGPWTAKTANGSGLVTDNKLVIKNVLFTEKTEKATDCQPYLISTSTKVLPIGAEGTGTLAVAVKRNSGCKKDKDENKIAPHKYLVSITGADVVRAPSFEGEDGFLRSSAERVHNIALRNLIAGTTLTVTVTAEDKAKKKIGTASTTNVAVVNRSVARPAVVVGSGS